MSQKIYSYLGFARKSNNLLAGTDACIEGMIKKKIYTLIIAEDLSERTKIKLMNVANDNDIRYYIYNRIEKLSQVTGQNNKGCYGVTDYNLSSAIDKVFKEVLINVKKGQ